MFLHNDELIQSLEGQVFVVNPKQIANLKKSYGDMDKTDEIDAFVIADYMRFGRLPMSVVKEEQYVALQRLTRARYQIVQQITQEKQRFLQYLSNKCNTFTENVESSVFGKAMMDICIKFLVRELIDNSIEKNKRMHSVINVCLPRSIHLERVISHIAYYIKDL